MASTSKASTSQAPKTPRDSAPGKKSQDPPATSPETSEQPTSSKRPPQTAPPLEPWMRTTVALQLKEVDGKVPNMTSEIFTTKMVTDQGFSLSETLSIHAFYTGMFYVTFMTMNACRRYWEAVKTAGPDSLFSRFLGNSPIKREERRVTVAVRNPHIPGKDISTFLSRYCTVVREPSHILNGVGFWTGKWSAVVRLHKDPASQDGLLHLPSSFFLGNSHGLIYYPDMPQTCRKCGQIGHEMKTCKELACKICRVLGHETKDCPKKATCNLCGLADHVYKDCPDRERSWAKVAAKAPVVVAAAIAAKTPTAPAKEPVAAKKKKAKPAKKKTGKTAPLPPPPSPIPPPPSSPFLPPPPSPSFEAAPSLPSVSGALSPAPRPTYPTAEPLTPPPGSVVFSLEDFPPLVSAGQAQRKRKGRRSPNPEAAKKLVMDSCDAPQSEEEEEEEMEQLAVELEEYEEVTNLQDNTIPDILDEMIEEELLKFEPAEPTDEGPPDSGGT